MKARTNEEIAVIEETLTSLANVIFTAENYSGAKLQVVLSSEDQNICYDVIFDSIWLLIFDLVNDVCNDLTRLNDLKPYLLVIT